MAKEIILLDESVSIPLPLIDKFAVGKPAVKVNPTGSFSDEQADALVKTYPLKYAIYDKANKDHAKLVKSGKYPEAKQTVINELTAVFASLSKENKNKVLEFMAKLQADSIKESNPPEGTPPANA